MSNRVTCFNRRGHHVRGNEFDGEKLDEYKGVQLKSVFTINHKGYAAMSASVSAAIRAAFGKNDVVHFHAEEPAFMCWLPKLFGKRVVVTIHGGGAILDTKTKRLQRDTYWKEMSMLGNITLVI